MEQFDPVLSELRDRLERLGYVVVPHGEHLCVRLPLLTSVRVRHGMGRLRLAPQFGPFSRSTGLLATSGIATVAVAATAILAAPVAATLCVGFLGVLALAHDACRFVVTEGALTRLQLLVTGSGTLALDGTSALNRIADVADNELQRLPSARSEGERVS